MSGSNYVGHFLASLVETVSVVCITTLHILRLFDLIFLANLGVIPWVLLHHPIEGLDA